MFSATVSQIAREQPPSFVYLGPKILSNTKAGLDLCTVQAGWSGQVLERGGGCRGAKILLSPESR